MRSGDDDGDALEPGSPCSAHRLYRGGRVLEALALSLSAAWCRAKARASDRAHSLAARACKYASEGLHQGTDPLGRVSGYQPRLRARQVVRVPAVLLR